MSFVRKVRKTHKWLMACVGLQVLIWSLTGLYMVSLDIHFIHGESLQANPRQPINPEMATYPVSELFRHYPQATEIELASRGERLVLVTMSQGEKVVLDAKTGHRLSLINEGEAREIALHNFSGDTGISEITLIKDIAEKPDELNARHLPVWKVTFEGISAPTLYINEQSGDVVTRRHNYWRLFDWMWRFHIMDYDDGENIGNLFLLIVSILTTLSAFAGLYLTWILVFKNNQKHTAEASR